MRIVILTFFLLLFAAASANTYSQRCGDGILFSFIKEGKNFLDSSEIKIRLKTYDRRIKFYNADHSVPTNDTTLDTTTYVTYVNEFDINITRNDSNKIYFPTLCGFYRMEFTFTDLIKGDTMKVIIRKIPHDIPIKLNDIIFIKGEYEFNFNGEIDALIFKADKDGIYNFDFSNFSVLEK